MEMEKVGSNHQTRTEDRKRPKGVTVIAMINIIAGVLITCGGLAAVIEEGPFVGLVILGIGAFLITIAVGLLKLKRWARIVTIGGYSVNLLGGIAQLGVNPFLGLFGILVAVAILIYLNTTGVKNAFANTFHSENRGRMIYPKPAGQVKDQI